MSELTVLLHPDPRLKKTCIPVTNIDKSIKKLCLDMIETMYKYSGVGLAASQVGILKRVVVMDCSEEGEKNPKVLINPEIIWLKKFIVIIKSHSFEGQLQQLAIPLKRLKMQLWN